MPKRGVLTKRERDDLIYPLRQVIGSRKLEIIERAVLLAAARRMARTHLTEYGTADCSAIKALRAWAKELSNE